MTPLPLVSVIVPVLNRERTIGRCLQSLGEMDYPSFEVIVVDNGSTDGTREVCSRYPVTLVREDKKGPYAARNKGLALSRGELVFFMDSDCIADKALLTRLVGNLTQDDIAGVGGQLQTYEPATLTEQFEDYAGILVYSLPKGTIAWNQRKFLSGGIFTANALFRKSILERLSGFDADFMSGGDYDLCWRVQRAGYRLVFDPEAVVKHAHRTSLRGLIKQFYKYGLDQPRLLKKQPHRYSFFKIKTYLWPAWEIRGRLPFRALVNIDSCNVFLVGLILGVFSPLFLWLSLAALALVLAGTLRQAARVVKKSGRLKWLAVFPFFHLVRNYSFTAGRLVGGVRNRVVAI